MNLLGALAGLLLAIFVDAYRYHGAAIDAYLHTSHLHVMDGVLLIFGSACVGGLTYSLFTQPDTFDGRGIFWLIIGGVMVLWFVMRTAIRRAVRTPQPPPYRRRTYRRRRSISRR